MAAIFDGVSSLLSIASGFGLPANGTYTIAGRMRTTMASDAPIAVLGETVTAVDSQHYRALRLVATRQARARTVSVSTASNANSGGSAASDAWSFIGANFQSNNFRYSHQDGTTGSSVTTTVTTNAPTTFWMGRQEGISPSFFSGAMAYFGIWTTDFNGSEWTALFRGAWPGSFKKASLVAFWPLDYDGRDMSGNGFHLTETNMTWGDSPLVARPSRNRNRPKSRFVFFNTNLSLFESSALSLTPRVNAATVLSCFLQEALSVTTASVNTAAALTLSSSESVGLSASVGVGAAVSMASAESLTMEPSVSVPTVVSMFSSESLSVVPAVDVSTSFVVASAESLALVTSLDVSSVLGLAEASSVALEASVGVSLSLSLSSAENLTLEPSAGVSTSFLMASAEDLSLSPSVNVTTTVTLAESSALSLDASVSVVTSMEVGSQEEMTLTPTGDQVIMRIFESSSLTIAAVSVSITTTLSLSSRETMFIYAFGAGDNLLAKIVLRHRIAQFIEAQRAAGYFNLSNFDVEETYLPESDRTKLGTTRGRCYLLAVAADDAKLTREYSHTTEFPIQIVYRHPINNANDMDLLDQLVTFEEQLRRVVKESVADDEDFDWTRTTSLKDEIGLPYSYVGLKHSGTFETNFYAFFTTVLQGGL